jgi:hypothetical protein
MTGRAERIWAYFNGLLADLKFATQTIDVTVHILGSNEGADWWAR